MSRRRRSVPWWAVAVVPAALLVLTGALPRTDAAVLAERVGPVPLVVGSLFVVVETLQVRGLGDLVADAAPGGTGTGRCSGWRGLSVVAANLLNNLSA